MSMSDSGTCKHEPRIYLGLNDGFMINYSQLSYPKNLIPIRTCGKCGVRIYSRSERWESCDSQTSDVISIMEERM